MVRKIFLSASLLLSVLIVLAALYRPWAWWLFLPLGPIILLGFYDMAQRRHTLRRIYPVIGHGRYMFESLRPEIQQYFVESNIDDTPFSREYRSIVYQRAKGDLDTRAFGTERNVNRVGYEWMDYSLSPLPRARREPRVRIGGEECRQPYLASHLNISAMSFGSLGATAVRALNRAARRGRFLHNTGEGGLSSHHLEEGGDLTWQVGTGYFGCRTPEGRFDAVQFRDKSRIENVKLVEIKLSQGAKPGHGGILPAAKVTPEIAAIRGVPLGRDVLSPPHHTAFSSPRGLLEFVARLRELSGGKPVGFKLCVGYRTEFLGIAKAMLETEILPDFITVDGAEGGSGAAPLELSNSVGMPLRDGLVFVHSALRGVGLRGRIRVFAAGKIITAFHLFRTLALGADLCNSARAMMFALGCIQARRCNTNTCPVGVATQDPARVGALDVEDKAERVFRYHEATIESLLELVASAGLEDPAQIQPQHVLKRVDTALIRDFSEIYSFLPEGALLEPSGLAPRWRREWEAASPACWRSSEGA